MTYLLDPNVLSEGMRPQPDPLVIAWLDQHQEELALVALLLAELASVRGLQNRFDHGASPVAHASRREFSGQSR
ncbi:MAG: hypothetical protein IPK22_23525 [Verrucomicrobiaceae bacterium]|nr:hypothetical protein [Verrucomicrobiaceae bacterium]